MKDLGKKIVDKIKEEGIAPRPRWQILVLHGLLWIAVALTIAIGSLVFGAILREMTMAEWGIIRRIAGYDARALIRVLPIFWLISLAGSVALSYVLYSRTQQGYRHHMLAVAGVAVGASVVLGSLFHASGSSRLVERILSERVGPYRMWIEEQEREYVVPERGVIAGAVTEVRTPSDFSLQSFRGDVWIVHILSGYAGPGALRAGIFVGAIGEKSGEFEFAAQEVFPLRRHHEEMFMMQPMRGEMDAPMMDFR